MLCWPTGSAQRSWLEREISGLPASVRYVLISLHHPPVADPQEGLLAGHNARPNEEALAEYLDQIEASCPARLIVSAGHIHNYERNVRHGVTYLVSGGGGARPYPVVRSPFDLYQGTDFPNFHYLRFEVARQALSVQMIRLRDPDVAAGEAAWDVRDRFEIAAKTP